MRYSYFTARALALLVSTGWLGSLYLVLACLGYAICAAQAVPYVPLGVNTFVDDLHNLGGVDEISLDRSVRIAGPHGGTVSLHVLGGDTNHHVAPVLSLIEIPGNEQGNDRNETRDGSASNSGPEWRDTVHFLFWYFVGSVIASGLAVIAFLPKGAFRLPNTNDQTGR